MGQRRLVVCILGCRHVCRFGTSIIPAALHYRCRDQAVADIGSGVSHVFHTHGIQLVALVIGLLSGSKLSGYRQHADNCQLYLEKTKYFKTEPVCANRYNPVKSALENVETCLVKSLSFC